MITGFNTDVKYADTVYHVQTEDKGRANPLIESLIYVKGAILDSFRTHYSNFLNSSGFQEVLLQRILEFQHRQIVGSIRKGKYKKGMLLEDFVDGEFIFNFQASIPPPKKEISSALTSEELPPPAVALPLDSIQLDAASSVNSAPPEPVPHRDPPAIIRRFPIEFEETPGVQLSGDGGIEIVVTGSKEFKAGTQVELDLCVQNRLDKTRLQNVQVLVKVIGTTFTPRLYAGKTDRQGSLQMNFSLPTFTAGSAALILQATTPNGGDEIKYLIKRR
ncbi:MAG: hypothetical protein U0V70_17025 [Terriglobia bacterium]